MARVILTALFVGAMVMLVGCGQAVEGKSQLMPSRTATSIARAPTLDVAGATELDLVEHVAANRQAYRQGLELLSKYYTETGNNMKLAWAKRERDALGTIPQYRYIIQAEVAGPDLKATTSIPDADDLFMDAVDIYDNAKLLIFVDNKRLRVALDKFNLLISKYPSSDKIDDAAFKAGEIYQHFKDYSIAVLYYKRTFQWDEDTIYPARFRAARILDNKLHKRDEALELYHQAIEKESWHYQYLQIAEKRIEQLSTVAEEQ